MRPRSGCCCRPSEDSSRTAIRSLGHAGQCTTAACNSCLLYTSRTDFLQQDSVLVFQCPDLRFKIGRLAVCLVQQRIQFRKVEVVFRHRGLHGALLGVGIQRAAALAALVLCRALSERNPDVYKRQP